MANGRYEKCESVKGSEEGYNGRLGCRCFEATVGCQSPDVKQKAKDGLQNVNGMSKIMVKNEGIVGSAAGENELPEFVWRFPFLLASTVTGTTYIFHLHLPGDKRHRSSPGTSKPCRSISHAANASSSSVKSWAAKDQLPN